LTFSANSVVSDSKAANGTAALRMESGTLNVQNTTNGGLGGVKVIMNGSGSVGVETAGTDAMKGVQLLLSNGVNLTSNIVLERPADLAKTNYSAYNRIAVQGGASVATVSGVISGDGGVNFFSMNSSGTPPPRAGYIYVTGVNTYTGGTLFTGNSGVADPTLIVAIVATNNRAFGTGDIIMGSNATISTGAAGDTTAGVGARTFANRVVALATGGNPRFAGAHDLTLTAASSSPRPPTIPYTTNSTLVRN